jgi:hypothetical protein
MEKSTPPKAWIVSVWTKRLGGGQPMLVFYVAGYSDPDEARSAVKAHIRALEGDEIGDAGAISDATADALGVTPSSVRML